MDPTLLQVASLETAGYWIVPTQKDFENLSMDDLDASLRRMSVNDSMLNISESGGGFMSNFLETD